MAEEYAYLHDMREDFRMDIAAQFTRVVIETNRIMPHTNDIRDIAYEPFREWLNDPTKRGFYVFRDRSFRKEKNGPRYFGFEAHFTDKDTAFHFKMRWR